MPYIDIHNERVWIPERPLRSMDEARPMRDGDLWRCPACVFCFNVCSTGSAVFFRSVG